MYRTRSRVAFVILLSVLRHQYRTQMRMSGINNLRSVLSYTVHIRHRLETSYRES